MKEYFALVGAATILAVPTAAFAQSAATAVDSATQNPIPVVVDRFTCPGDPPNNLASFHCYFTPRMRLEKFVEGAVTDQSIVQAAFFAAIAQKQDDPVEWETDGRGYGQRFGTRYTQALVKGGVNYAIGALLGTDPRQIRYADERPAGTSQLARAGHVFVNWVTVRKSSREGRGARVPNAALFAGIAASAAVGNLWYPEQVRTPSATAKRLVGPLATSLFASFWNEYGTDVTRGISRIFKRGRQEQPTP